MSAPSELSLHQAEVVARWADALAKHGTTIWELNIVGSVTRNRGGKGHFRMWHRPTLRRLSAALRSRVRQNGVSRRVRCVASSAHAGRNRCAVYFKFRLESVQ